jgi:hypothetical protein
MILIMSNSEANVIQAVRNRADFEPSKILLM